MYYLFWMVIFISVNIVWDIKTDKTPRFHLHKLRDKGNLIHHAASFCSYLLVLVAVFNEDVWRLAIELRIPLIIVGFAGLFSTIPSLCPYPMEKITSPVPAEE